MKYILGLDIGVTSVGWSVLNLDNKRIESLGVRLFPEKRSKKLSGSQERRNYRGTRRTIRRKALRMSDIRNLFEEYNLVSNFLNENGTLSFKTNNPWHYRALGLKRKLNNKEFACALYHIAKNRGFKSNSKLSKKDDEEEGLMLSGISTTKKKLCNSKYQTVGEMFHCHNDYKNKKRNGEQNYNNTIGRNELIEEINILFQKQKEYNNKFATEEFKNAYLEIFSRQRPFASGDSIIKLVNNCPLEKTEKCAPKHSYTYEYFILLENLNNLRYVNNDGIHALTQDQIKLIREYVLENTKITYAKLRQLLNLDPNIYFNHLDYQNNKNCESQKPFADMKGFRELVKVFGLQDFQFAFNYDELAYALTCYKNDQDITKYLKENFYNEETIQLCLNHDGFTGFGKLSIKALEKITPFMKQGHNYYNACKLAGYPKETTKYDLLPNIDEQSITNHTVLRAFTQTRKIFNAIVRKYGKPYSVHIETSRELGKSINDRNKIRSQNTLNAKKKLEVKSKIAELINHNNRSDLAMTPEKVPEYIYQKYILLEEQNYMCAYSGQPITFDMMMTNNMVEIDHILPESRSFDNSQSNKVLVLIEQNKLKNNRTPYEWLGQYPDQWNKFTNWVENNIQNKIKRNNLLLKQFDETDWRTRALNDTKYIAIEFSNFIKNNFNFENNDNKTCVVLIKSGIISRVRTFWGLNKDRNNDLHHAIDASVAAAINPKIIELISQENSTMGYIPQPWKNFSQELKARISENPKEEIKNLNLESYENYDEIKSVAISLMPDYKINGKLNKDTFHSPKSFDSRSGILYKNGYVERGEIKRIDIYAKNKKYFFVPVYARDLMLKQIPKRAIITGERNENNWTIMDETFKFEFSVMTNDLIKISDKNTETFAYVESIDRNTTAFTMSHLNPYLRENFNKENKPFRKSLGNVQSIEKYSIDILGLNIVKSK